MTEFVVTYGGTTRTFQMGSHETIGSLKERVQREFKLSSCKLVGLDTSTVPLASLSMKERQPIVVVGASSGPREFALTHINPKAKVQPPKALCTQCKVLMRRVLLLTNQVYMHDHEQCRKERLLLQDRVEQASGNSSFQERQRLREANAGLREQVQMYRRREVIEAKNPHTQQLELQLDVLQKQNQSLKDQCRGLTDDKKNLNKLLSETDHRREGWKKNFQEARAQIEILQGRLKEKNDSLEEQAVVMAGLQKLAGRAHDAQDRIRTLERQLQEQSVIAKQCKSLLREKETMRARIAELQALNKTLGDKSKRVSVLEAELEMLQGEHASTKKQLAASGRMDPKVMKAINEHKMCAGVMRRLRSKISSLQATETKRQSLTEQAAAYLSQSKPQIGCDVQESYKTPVVGRVKSGKAADAAGLREKDLIGIVRVETPASEPEFTSGGGGLAEGQSYAGRNGFIRFIRSRKPGDVLVISVTRGKLHFPVRLTLGTEGLNMDTVRALSRVANGLGLEEDYAVAEETLKDFIPDSSAAPDERKSSS